MRADTNGHNPSKRNTLLMSLAHGRLAWSRRRDGLSGGFGTGDGLDGDMKEHVTH